MTPKSPPDKTTEIPPSGDGFSRPEETPPPALDPSHPAAATLDAFKSGGKDLLDEMNGAVQWINEVEKMTGENVDEAERELRHAGHLAVSTIANCDESAPPDFNAARGHVLRAKHIAVAVLVSRISDEAYALQENVGKLLLSERFKDYGDFFAQIDNAGEIAQKSAESDKARGELFAWAETEWPETKKLCRSLRAMAPAILDAKQAEDDAKRTENNARRKADRRSAVGILIGILGAIAGILGWLF